MVELIDTHAHLDFPDYDGDRDEVIRRAIAAGVTRIVTVGTGLDSSRRAIELAERFDGVFAAVGIHPHDCESASEEALDSLRKLALHPKVVAIGETGLDYHYLPSKTAAKIRQLTAPPLAITGALPERDVEPEPSDIAPDLIYKSRQTFIFRKQLELAIELGKPVIIHQRESFDDTMSVLQSYVAGVVGELRGVFHCFGEDLRRARQVLALGFHISLTGILTFKNAELLRRVASVVPLENLMVETDCPFLAPHPFRGKRCEPAYVRFTAEQLGKVRGVPFETIARATTDNARRLFSI